MSISTKLLPTSLLNTVKRSRPIYALGRRLRFASGSRLGARYIPALGTRAHFNDFMLNSDKESDVESYRRGAEAFVAILEESLQASGHDWPSITKALEIGCGYGRIVRELRGKLPATRIDVCDVIEEGARFTAAEFGVRRIPIIERAGPDYTNTYDLIYLLSVYTHLRIDIVEANLRSAVAALKTSGVIVFTIHGQVSANTAERYQQYWLDKTRVLQAMANEGYYYERYPYYYDEYGLTWFTRSAVDALVARVAPELEFVRYNAAILDEHQDVFVYRKK